MSGEEESLAGSIAGWFYGLDSEMVSWIQFSSYFLDSEINLDLDAFASLPI